MVVTVNYTKQGKPQNQRRMQQKQCGCLKRSITGGCAFSVGRLRALSKYKIYDKNRTKQDRDTMDHFIMERIGNHTLPTNAVPTNDPLFHYHAEHSSSIYHLIFFNRKCCIYGLYTANDTMPFIDVNQNSSYLCSLSSLVNQFCSSDTTNLRSGSHRMLLRVSLLPKFTQSSSKNEN